MSETMGEVSNEKPTVLIVVILVMGACFWAYNSFYSGDDSGAMDVYEISENLAMPEIKRLPEKTYQYALVYITATNEKCLHWKTPIFKGWNVRVSYSFAVDREDRLAPGHYWILCKDAIGEIRSFCSNSGYKYGERP